MHQYRWLTKGPAYNDFVFKLELQVQVHNENQKAAQKCILVFQVAQGNAYMSLGSPGALGPQGLQGKPGPPVYQDYKA